MKRKLIAVTLSLLAFLTASIHPCATMDVCDLIESTTHSISTERIPLDNGDYLVIQLITYKEKHSEGANYHTDSAKYTKKGRKFATRYNSDGQIVWQYILEGTFSVINGVSANCTDSSYSTDIRISNWSFSDGNATKSGNKATGVGTFKYKRLWIVVTETVKIDLSITCDVNGNLS